MPHADRAGFENTLADRRGRSRSERAFARVARREGYEIVSASTGEAALSILRGAERIDWLLTDVCLPGFIDGWVVGSEFSLTHPLRPVIYISGVEHDSVCRTAASIFLKKPVMIADLIKTFQHMSLLAGPAHAPA